MEDLSGMTINERLFVLKKLDRFDKAITQGNTREAIKILESCNLPQSSAIATVTEVFKNPSMYGYIVK